MPHIPLQDGLAGIRGLLTYRPETARPMGELAEVLLRGPGTLTRAEREMIAAHVSFRNDCHYCQCCHAAIAAEHLGGGEEHYALVGQVQRDPEAAPISGKMKALLAIAGRVQEDGKLVRGADIDRARQQGATDLEIHDVVLIAAAFCMFNRYVDGLGTWQPADPALYRAFGQTTAELGYANRTYTAPVEK
jgi:uncharacterized peroxidase-related enzyme